VKRRDRQSGAVLITVMLVMLCLLGLGMTALWMTTGNLQMGGNTNLRNQALYVAEAGIEAARIDMLRRGTWTPTSTQALLTGSTTTAATSPACAYVDEPPSSPIGVDSTKNYAPSGAGAIYRPVDSLGVLQAPLRCVDFPGTTITRSSTTSSTLGQYTVWVRNDTSELRTAPGNATCTGSGWNAANCPVVTDANGTLVVRSLGVASDGRTQVVIEATLGPGTAPFTPNPPVLGGNQTLCVTGKNACDDNSSMIAGVTAQ
jgi:hypothetical protein